MRKLILPAILSLTIGIVISSCTGNTKNNDKRSGIEYYRQLQFSETPYDIEKGTHPITEAEAKDVNSYKFRYDEGKLVSIEYQRNNVLLDYSSMGAAKVTYTYNGNMQTKQWFDSNGKSIPNGGVWAAEYAMNNDGMRVSMMYYDSTGTMIDNRNGIHSWTWSKLPDGMVKQNRYNLKGEEVVMNPFCPFYELRFTYDDKGFTTRMANYMADTLYNCTAENCGDIGVSYFQFTPNQYGDVERFEVFNATGQMSNLYWGWSKRLQKFDANGYTVETSYFDQDNEPVSGKQVPVTKYTYDDHGAVTEVRCFDSNGNPINNPSNGIAVTQYKYDNDGRRVETLTFDINNVAVNTSTN